jgi:hypothetical protein
MMFKKIITAIFVMALISISGCANMNDVVRAKETGKEGVTKTYSVTSDQAWEIAKAVFRWEGSDTIEEHKNEGYMLTSSGLNGYSYGAVMGAWIKPINKGSTEVTVITKRRIQTDIFTTLTEETYHKRFAQAVEITKGGNPLPRVAP